MAKGKKSRATRTDSSLGRPQYASAPTHGSRYDKRIHVLGLHGEEPRELTLDETKCLLVDWHAKPKPLTLTLTMMDPLRPLFGLANYAGNVGSMLCSHPRPRMQTASEAHETTSVTELESIAQAPTHVFEVISLSPVSTHTAQFVNGGAREAIDAVEAMYTGRSWHTRQGIGALRLTEISAWRSDALSRDLSDRGRNGSLITAHILGSDLHPFGLTHWQSNDLQRIGDHIRRIAEGQWPAGGSILLRRSNMSPEHTRCLFTDLTTSMMTPSKSARNFPLVVRVWQAEGSCLKQEELTLRLHEDALTLIDDLATSQDGADGDAVALIFARGQQVEQA